LQFRRRAQNRTSAETNVSRHEHDSTDRSLLLLISESTSLPADVRSRDRDVHTWHEETCGDPADPASYEWARAAPAVTAVIDLPSPERSRAALVALRQVRPDSAVLLLSATVQDIVRPGDGTLARTGRLRDVLRLDLDEELVRLEAERRVFCLREFAAGTDVVPIMIHEDPDPDAVSSAMAVVALLGGSTTRTPIVTLDEIMRPENRRMAELLHIQVTQVTPDELRAFGRVIMVDTQPRGVQRDGRPRLAVIDHHPLEHSYRAEFTDIRPDYGATATMMTEYLRSGGSEAIPRGLATALLYGIRTDTDSLVRQVSPADVEAYAFLQSHADLHLIRRFERPSYSQESARAFGEALAAAHHDGDLCVAYIGAISNHDSHMLADLADFCLGIENITWACAAAQVENELVLTLRYVGQEPGAGDMARAIAEQVGGGSSGGGHGSMARVVVPADVGGDDPAAAIHRLVRDGIATVHTPQDEGGGANRRS
jgi:nanoRNase/pAp phosphatase (c-di-AMP/oligoRNAs hydrolase)